MRARFSFGSSANTLPGGTRDLTMRRLPTLDEQESGHDVVTAEAAGDMDALDGLWIIAETGGFGL